MNLIAHRGLYNNKSEQNTMKAFINSINDPNYVGFECDIRQTKDKKFIINHDAFINDKLIFNTNYNELKMYNIAKLSDILKLNTNKIILIEVKDKLLNYKKLNNLLNKYSSKNIYVMSFHDKVIRNLDALNHKYKLGLLNYVLNNKKEYPYNFICLLDKLTSKNQIDEYLRNAKKVFIYGIINDKKLNHGKECYYIVDP